MKIEVYVVSHKAAKMPSDEMYVPVQVGNNPQNFKGYLRDNTGINISNKNTASTIIAVLMNIRKGIDKIK